MDFPFFLSHMISRWQITSASGRSFCIAVVLRKWVRSKKSSTTRVIPILKCSLPLFLASIKDGTNRLMWKAGACQPVMRKAVFIMIAVHLHLKNARLALSLSRLSRTILSHAGRYLKHTRNSREPFVGGMLHRYCVR